MMRMIMFHLFHNQKNTYTRLQGLVSSEEGRSGGAQKIFSTMRAALFTLTTIMAIAVSSCIRETLPAPEGDEGLYEPGHRTTISLNMEIPEMDIATRADMAQGADSKLNSLWVGIFSANTGQCTYANLISNMVQEEEELVDLTADMFHVWNGVGPDASVNPNANPDTGNNIGRSVNAGAVIMGPASGSVPGNNYADVTGYLEIRIQGTPRMNVRIIFNRQEMGDSGAYTEKSVQLGTDGTGVIDISDLPYVHINSIKVPWDGSTNVTVTSIKLYKKTEGAWLSEEHGNGTNYLTLNNITTLSGPSYIVAVGNPEGNNGSLYSGSDVRTVSLAELLPSDTETANGRGFVWDTYKNIVYSRKSLDNVTDVPTGNLPMSGIYIKSLSTHPEPTAADWEELHENVVNIPTTDPGKTVTLPGAVHLRRLISQVKFNVKAADYRGTDANKQGKRIVKVVLDSYRIFNAPFTSWLHERKSPSDDANSGDMIKLPAVSYENAGFPHKANYPTSTIYRGTQYITGSESTGYAFDFWMLENKRRALSESPIAYDDREREIKRDDGLNQGTVSNTGIYTALCGDDGTETMNNMATFVELRCKIEYTEAGIGSLKGTEEYDDVDIRTADAVYTIHLGGIGNDWNDFTHRRNHKYTYNVTVMDVDRIIVEAKGGEESRPGIEGVVNDVVRPAFVLDAHYSVFNIQLSNKERTGGSASPYTDGFPFRIQVYDRYGNPIIIDQTNYKEYNNTTGNIPGDDTTVKPEYYWTWVEFRPTTGENVLAEYKPYHRKDANGRYIDEAGYVYDDENKTFRLNELADIRNYPGLGANANDPDDETLRWYTVFVNEYTYETSNDETKNRWVLYANRQDRICWLNTLNDISADRESAYIRSKYTLIQKSIQTFYNIKDINVDDINLDAVGLEHTNETYGFTLRWANRSGISWNDNNGVNGLSLDNGKRNTRYYLRYDGNTDDTENINWSRYVTQTTLQKITNLNRDAFQFSDARVTGLPTEGTYYVPATVTYNYYPNSGAWGAVNPRRYVPNTSQAVQAIEACMNRNRDNNGNGKIDREEVRWYLPASSEMVDLVNGSRSLETPLMDYPSTPILISPPMENSNDNKHHVNTRYHYATSNHRLLWAEEGITINPTVDTETSWNRMGWQVRCARALGTDLKEETNLSSAFEVDNPNAPTKIYPTYFDGKSLRDPVYGALPPHSETSPLNRISSTGFEFRRELIQESNYNYNYKNDEALQNPATHDDYIIAGNRRCAERFGENWRMPNIKECSVLKVALNQANLNYDYSGDLDSETDVCQVRGYDIGNYFACTYREYGVNNSPNFERADTDPTGYYLGIVYDNDTANNDVGDESVRKLGRAQCLTQPAPTYFIRCVRDL